MVSETSSLVTPSSSGESGTNRSAISACTIREVRGKDLFLLGMFRTRLKYPAHNHATCKQQRLSEATIVLIGDKPAKNVHDPNNNGGFSAYVASIRVSWRIERSRINPLRRLTQSKRSQGKTYV